MLGGQRVYRAGRSTLARCAAPSTTATLPSATAAAIRRASSTEAARSSAPATSVSAPRCAGGRLRDPDVRWPRNMRRIPRWASRRASRERAPRSDDPDACNPIVRRRDRRSPRRHPCERPKRGPSHAAGEAGLVTAPQATTRSIRSGAWAATQSATMAPSERPQIAARSMSSRSSRRIRSQPRSSVGSRPARRSRGPRAVRRAGPG